MIVAVNNTEVSNVSAYNTQLMQQKPEDTCNLKVKRKGSNGYTEITCQVKIGVMNLAEIRRIYEVYFNSPRGRENQMRIFLCKSKQN